MLAGNPSMRWSQALSLPTLSPHSFLRHSWSFAAPLTSQASSLQPPALVLTLPFSLVTSQMFTRIFYLSSFWTPVKYHLSERPSLTTFKIKISSPNTIYPKFIVLFFIHSTYHLSHAILIYSFVHLYLHSSQEFKLPKRQDFV